MSDLTIRFDPQSVTSYEQFLKVRRLPRYQFCGRAAVVPEEYAAYMGSAAESNANEYIDLCPSLFDYQRDISALAIRRERFAVFADCGLGKTLIILEFARHAYRVTGKKVLIVAPLMVAAQTAAEHAAFYPNDSRIPFKNASDLREWLNNDELGIVVTNYEAIRDDLPESDLGGLILDESSILKHHYGKWGARLIEMGRGVRFKLAATGTPAPNDRIEYANHAVFLDKAKTVNEFLASYFINRGQTQNRWEIKPHAIGPFYRALSGWSIFLNSPADYGWSDNVASIPPIHIHREDVPLTDEQRRAAQMLTGALLTANTGGITTRGKLSQIAKGKGVRSNKPGFIRDMIVAWPDESVIIWCQYNDEQETLAKLIPEAGSITGATSLDDRHRIVRAFQEGRIRILITKPKILGFGINLQIATRHVFSGIKDSYEEFYQAVKRSNRVGSTKPLHVHIPVTELEEPFLDNVLRKADRVEADTEEQQRLFKEYGYGFE